MRTLAIDARPRGCALIGLALPLALALSSSGCKTDDRRVDVASIQSCEGESCQGTKNGLEGGAGTADAGPQPGDGEGPGRIAALGDGAACLSRESGAALRPLAIYLMLDSSGSMLEADGKSTKWDSVHAALRAFLAETSESDLQLGLQFFPLLKPGSSFTCTSHEDCGPDGGPCFLSTCTAGGTITLCRTDADCEPTPEGNTCEVFGLCSGSNPDAPLACLLGNGTTSCASGLGVCEDFERTCTNATSCETSAYGTPTVEIAPVSSNLAAIEAAMAGRMPQGLTPTLPALQGALAHARQWALTHPEQDVATLLVTDGLPTECATDPLMPSSDSEAIVSAVVDTAATGFADAVSIRTFVIGVFSPGVDSSIDNVNAIARAGGTDSAFFIDASGAVEQQFLAGLRNVRDAAGTCRVPLVSTSALDFFHADVKLGSGNGAPELVPNVSGLLGCAATPEAWYYDVPPAQGEPQAIELCPDLCRVVRSSPQAGLSIEVGCAAAE